MFSVENGRHAIQRTRARAFFECDNTSFETSRTDLRLVENEHGTTTAKGHRRTQLAVNDRHTPARKDRPDGAA